MSLLTAVNVVCVQSALEEFPTGRCVWENILTKGFIPLKTRVLRSILCYIHSKYMYIVVISV